jgi:hypothetical protein
VYVVDDDEVTLDVTRCNHVPTCIYGEQTFDEDGGQRVGCWLAMLESLDTVRIEQPGGPRMRLLARYFVAIDDCTERSRGKAG